MVSWFHILLKFARRSEGSKGLLALKQKNILFGRHYERGPYHLPCKLFKTVAGYWRKEACFQFATSVRIHVSPIIAVSLKQMSSNGTRDLELVTCPESCRI